MNAERAISFNLVKPSAKDAKEASDCNRELRSSEPKAAHHQNNVSHQDMLSKTIEKDVAEKKIHTSNSLST